MPQFDGTYTRHAGARRSYAYRITYGVRGKVLAWQAAVHCGDTIKGHPEGELAFDLPPLEDEQRANAERLAREAIEALAGIDE